MSEWNEALNEADEVIEFESGVSIVRSGSTLIWNDSGEVWSEDFLSTAGAKDALEQQREDNE